MSAVIKSPSDLAQIIQSLKDNHLATFLEPISGREIESLLRLYYTSKREEWLKSRLGDFSIPEYQGLIELIKGPTLQGQYSKESPLRQAAAEAIDAEAMAVSLQSAIKAAQAKGELEQAPPATIKPASNKKQHK